MVHGPIKFIYKRRGKFAVSKFVKILLTYLPTNLLIRKKAAFTLAEVLITLGIIGIVAAMTLPALINNYRTKEASTRLKKFYSAMSQAIMLSENDNGPSIDWDKTYYGDIKDEDGNVSAEGNRNATIAFFNKYIKPYIKYVKVDENPVDLQDEETGQTNSIRVYFADGSVMTMFNGACIDLNFDVNENKPPNEYGKDVFKFVLCPQNKAEQECGGNKNWCAYCPTSICNTTRENALQRCKTLPQTCARVLIMDGWEFKEDYPHKL